MIDCSACPRRRRGLWPVFLLAAMLAAGIAQVWAQDVPREVKEGSSRLEVPYEASPDGVVRSMLDLAGLARGDVIVDLGSGDGRIVIAAAREHGARGFGVDLNEELVAIANARARSAGLADRAGFYVRDIFKTGLRGASVVTAFLSPELMLRLRPKLLGELAPGARVVSHQHHMGEWRPDAARVVAGGGGRESVVYRWVIPGDVRGIWQWDIDSPRLSEMPLRYVGKFQQSYQDLRGKVEIGIRSMDVREALIRGRRVQFSITGELGTRIIRQEFEGRLEGDRIEGSVRLSGGIAPTVLPWRAWRAAGIFR